jgi:hypothetical protein
MFTLSCKQKSIILPLFDPKAVKNILLQKVSFYQFKQRHNPQGSNKDLLNFPSASFHSSYSYTLRQIHVECYTNGWFVYIFVNLLLSNFEQRNLSLSVFHSHYLQINKYQTDWIQAVFLLPAVCKFRSFIVGWNSLGNIWQGK